MILAVSAQAAVTIETFSAESASTVAGAHAEATISFSFKAIYGSQQRTPLGGDVNDIIVKLPPGLVGDLNNVPKCPRALFDLSAINISGGGCPADTQVGLATVTIGIEILGGISEQTLGVFNVQPGPNEPAFLGVEGIISGVGVVAPIYIKVSAADNYAVTATAAEVHETPLLAKLLGSTVTLWGVPAAHERANGSSNWHGFLGELTPPSSATEWKPLMENPTSCASVLQTTLSVNTYQEPDVFTTSLASSPIGTSCATVPFAPSIKAEPDTAQAGAPAGLDFELTLPQTNDPSEQGTSELEKAVVTLPQGMTISPSAASRLLEGCTDEQFGAGSDAPAACPAASVIGEDEVESPLVLSGPLKGRVYLGQPLSTDPTSGQMFRVFQELKGFGLDIKLQGSVTADPSTGQLTATFANLPELPFEHFRLRFNGGPNAVLVNPTTCGAHTTTAQLYPYSNPTSPATPSSTFDTSFDGNGAPCPATLPFDPSSSVSTGSSQAGALSPLTVSFSRGDGTQPLGRIDATLPEGLLGYVSKVALCETAAALAGACGAESRIGTVGTSAGAGSDPLKVQGSVYLARGTGGYPFMLSVVVPAVAGPYNLGNVVVPVYLQVNNDGSLTAVSGPLPSILDGIPLDIRSVTMSIDRPGFTLNPTYCGPLALSGVATSLSGSTAPLSAPFAVSGCGSLSFKPSFTVATQGDTSKANGASLSVRVSQAPGEADIHSVRVELPKSLPSRLTTLQKACPEVTFYANPATCDHASIVGTAIAYTPLLSAPLTGPAYFVSHGGAKFPELILVLQGDGITIELGGETFISKAGITSSTFAAVPDVPISGFELKLPEGPYSALAANGTLCSQKLLMPTTLTGQNGVVVRQSTRIAVSGCPAAKPAVKVTKTTLKGDSLMVAVKTSEGGMLKITGRDLKTTTTRNVKAGTHQITVTLTDAGRALRAHREKLELRASLSTGKQAVANTTSVKL